MTYPIEVCMSAAGYYVGQTDEDGLPYSRLSGYYQTHEEAESAMKNGFPLRDCIENRALNKKLVEGGMLK